MTAPHVLDVGMEFLSASKQQGHGVMDWAMLTGVGHAADKAILLGLRDLGEGLVEVGEWIAAWRGYDPYNHCGSEGD